MQFYKKMNIDSIKIDFDDGNWLKFRMQMLVCETCANKFVCWLKEIESVKSIIICNQNHLYRRFSRNGLSQGDIIFACPGHGYWEKEVYFISLSALWQKYWDIFGLISNKYSEFTVFSYSWDERGELTGISARLFKNLIQPISSAWPSFCTTTTQWHIL